MERVNVNGNAENITFVLNDANTEIRGMNKVECSNMIIRMVDAKVNQVSFLNKPDALFIPPHEIEEPATRLKGFKWRVKEKPAKADVNIRAKVVQNQSNLWRLKRGKRRLLPLSAAFEIARQPFNTKNLLPVQFFVQKFVQLFYIYVEYTVAYP
jgi:hypothetical protein